MYIYSTYIYYIHFCIPYYICIIFIYQQIDINQSILSNQRNYDVNYDVICLSETYLDSSILSDNKNLEIPGYNLIRADHPSNSKRGGVCVYYRNSLPLKILDIFYLQECIFFEFKIGNKLCKIVSL